MRGVPAGYSREQDGADFLGCRLRRMRPERDVRDWGTTLSRSECSKCAREESGNWREQSFLSSPFVPFTAEPRKLPSGRGFENFGRENLKMKGFVRNVFSAFRKRHVLVAIGLLLLVAGPVLAQNGNSPWENAVNVLETAFTSTIARGLSLVAIVVSGLTFAPLRATSAIRSTLWCNSNGGPAGALFLRCSKSIGMTPTPTNTNSAQSTRSERNPDERHRKPQNVFPICGGLHQ